MSESVNLFQRFAQYPFSEDPVFQSGLPTILESLQGKSSEEINEIIGKAQAFYFTKTSGEELRWEEFVRYRDQHPEIWDTAMFGIAGEQQDVGQELNEADPIVAGGLDGAPAPLSFTKLADLISSGQTHLIPNNEIIPNELNEASPSESRATIRRKPWETSSSTPIEGAISAE